MVMVNGRIPGDIEDPSIGTRTGHFKPLYGAF